MRYLRRKTTEALPPPSPASRITPPLEGVELPSYSAEEGTCGKCGAARAGTAYCPTTVACTHISNLGRKAMWGQERMHRACTRCGFAWDEQLPEVHDG